MEIREAWNKLKEKKKQYKEREQELSRKMIKRNDRKANQSSDLQDISEEEVTDAEIKKPGWIMRLIIWVVSMYIKMLFRPVFIFLKKINFVMKMINWGLKIGRFLYYSVWLRFHGVFTFCILAPISFVLSLCFKRRAVASSGRKVD